MTDDPNLQALVEQMTRKLADEGRLIEVGWESMRLCVLSPGAPTAQLQEMRMAFFAGAQHLFASIMAGLDGGDEPTEADLGRMEKIHNELEAFGQEVRRRAEAAGN